MEERLAPRRRQRFEQHAVDHARHRVGDSKELPALVGQPERVGASVLPIASLPQQTAMHEALHHFTRRAPVDAGSPGHGGEVDALVLGHHEQHGELPRSDEPEAVGMEEPVSGQARIMQKPVRWAVHGAR
jgi:hypothetical protein